MSITWMALIAALTTLEKTIPCRRAATWGTAGVLIALARSQRYGTTSQGWQFRVTVNAPSTRCRRCLRFAPHAALEALRDTLNSR
jgi:hypothetical protein